MLIQQLKNPLTGEYKNLKKYILGEEIEWYWKPNCVPESKNGPLEFLSHNVLSRPFPPDGPLYPKSYSSIIDSCDYVLKQIFFHNNISLDYVLRINLNLTLPSSQRTSTYPHTDHQFDHKNLIIYLNESDGETVLCDDDGKKLEFSEPEEDKIITFTGKHYHFLPTKNSRRVVMVCTYV